MLRSTSAKGAVAVATKASDGVHEEGGSVWRMNHYAQDVNRAGARYYDGLAKFVW